jgi:hypothetical protein
MIRKKYLEGIESTGFELEFRVSNSLTKAGWTVINNKYYIDDVVGSAREMDILAYKATLLENGISVYTVLFVSCKKSAKNIWTFLAKDINKEDPNIDWYPISAWTNDVASKFMIDNSNWKFDYTESTAELKENIFTPKKHIFAFQELNKEGGSAQNDRAIFDSIVTLMMAQDYEIRSLDNRKKDRSIYFTSLILITWNDSKDCPALHVDEFMDEQQYSQLKEIEEVDKKVKEALKNIYHYEGDYYFTEDLPF